MLNPTLHVLLVSAQAADIGQYITLSFTTPLRLQHNCRALAPDKLDARTLLMALARRASLLAEFDGNGPLVEDFAPLREACAGIHDDKHLAWRDWTHYSSSQQQKMTLDRVVGEWTLKDPLGQFSNFRKNEVAALRGSA